MLTRLSPDDSSKNCVPLRIRKEMTRRTLIRKHEDHPVSSLLSDRYLAGLGMCKQDWLDAIALLCEANPSKRMKMDEATETRSAVLVRVRELIAKHKGRNENDLLVLREEDSSFEHVCRDLSLEAIGFDAKLTRVATLTERGSVIYDVLRPSARPMVMSSVKKLAVFSSNYLSRRMFPSSSSLNSEDYPFKGYKFVLTDLTALKRLVKKGFDDGVAVSRIFHRSSELHDYCKGLEAGVDDSETSSLEVKPLSSDSDETSYVESARNNPSSVEEDDVEPDEPDALESTAADKKRATWNTLMPDRCVWAELEAEGEFELIRAAKLDNNSDPIVSKPLAFPNVPSEGFIDSAQLLFYYVQQLELNKSKDELNRERQLMPLITEGLSALQEALAYSNTLKREEIVVDGELVSEGKSYAWATHKHIRVYLDYPSVDEVEAIHAWLGKIIADINKGKAIRDAAISAEQQVADVRYHHDTRSSPPKCHPNRGDATDDAELDESS